MGVPKNRGVSLPSDARTLTELRCFYRIVADGACYHYV